MLEFLVIYAVVIAVLLTIGETLILLKTDKYWPLSLDDYASCVLLAYSALTLEHQLSQLLMLLAWAFMAGNLYAMLFTRMDPNGGSRERLGALTVLMIAAIIGAITTLALILGA